MLKPLSPFDAYRTDLDRTNSRSEFGGSDTAWLLMAHCLNRLSRVGDSVREQLARQSAEALRDLRGSGSETPASSSQHATDFDRLIGGLTTIDSPMGADSVARSVRGFSLRMSEAGALSVAYSLLGSARTALTQSSDRERGLLAAEQARVARLLGDLDSADELYRVSALIGERASDSDLLSRSALGRGVLARIRGNYPRARMFFLEGLRLARAAGSDELQYLGHQGMTIVSGVTGDFSAGIEHGWSAYELGAGDETREGESLTNLAHLCLDAGYPAAALRAFLSALSRSSVLRVRLPGLGGAALAAGRVGDRQRLDRLSDEISRTVERSMMPYENAFALRNLAIAYQALGDDVTSERFRQVTLKIAREKGYHEIEVTTERAELARSAPSSQPRELEPKPQSLVFSLEQFEPEADEAAFAATRWG
jgi:tetratricopeptide (TPR) repeat protein